MKNIFLWIGLVLASVALWLLSSEAVWQYLFFLRASILISLLLVTLPLIAKFFLPAMLKNLFVLRGKWQLAAAIVSALAVGVAVILVAIVTLRNAPARFGVAQWQEIPELWQYGLAIALSLPICITTTDLSREKLNNKEVWTGAIAGAVASIGLLFAVSSTRKWLAANTILKQLLVDIISFFAKHETNGYIDPQTGTLARGHLTSVAFLLVGLVVYALVGIFFQPRPSSERDEAPALVYLMLIISVTTLLFGGATFYFDFYRVPVLVIFAIFSAFAYRVLRVDHFFELKEDKRKHKGDDDELKNFKQVLEKRLQHQKGDRTLVIICASGGGIQAAGWTAQVLTGLQELLGKTFTKAIGLISSVSGGSVGVMYYLDRFNEQGYAELEYVTEPSYSEKDPLQKDKFTTISRSAMRDSLDATGWGLAYPDLWRILGLSFLVPKMCDRGSALETDWQGEMKQPQTKKTLATWRQQILKGEIPVPIFNATLVESGCRFLMSPMTFGESYEKKYLDFNTLYGDYDINVVTAARLSANFPYVSPICRNAKTPKPLARNYHVADGGYFDNSGFVTALEWLNEWLAPEKNLNIKKVLVLQINAFPESPSIDSVKGDGGWLMATIGPLLTLYKVRDPILTARNFTEVEILKKQWKNQVEIQYFPIFFPSPEEFPKESSEKAPKFYSKEGRYLPPLSWKLTDKEKQAINKGWESIKDKEQIQNLKKLWTDDWGMQDELSSGC